MKYASLLSTCLLSHALYAAPNSSEEVNCSTLDTIPNVVTNDIKAGIEKHIEDLSELNGGFFPISFDGEDMKLKLVRVHMEYLANLGPRRHFACVDLASEEGNVYDVDFFLEGDPGDMTVTETTVHKLNGRPFYLWRETEEGVWVHVDADDASRELLGVREGDDVFEFTYQATLPEMSEPAKMWIPIPTDDQFQDITMNRIEIPGKHQILTEQKYGNQILYVELQPEDSGKTMVLHFNVNRQEKTVHTDKTKPEVYLLEDNMVPLNDKFKTIAKNALKDKNGGDLVRARALYDHTIDSMKYAKFGSGWGNGDANFACDSARGNCTDYHSYFIALCRSVDIPARFAIGAAVPSSRDDGGVNGYHCWAEFYAEGKWWPVDISEADKYAALATYYFGHNPANRVEFSRGRDLVVTPGPESGPINFLAYPLLEVGGKPVKVKPQFGFQRIG
ncbi:MAG: transglutaminase domain-containing protein [Phycisphaerales bacterium]|nr:transglutaminase domain-containing protein [Planctomycetota bacterium]MBL6997124.1 transglutaminase domain-containing protein [Phycisphaerales bacterium]